MEFQKIINFLDITSDNKDLPKFVTKTWIDVYDQSEKNYNWNKEIRIKTSMIRSDLCDFNNVGKGNIVVAYCCKRKYYCHRTRWCKKK